MSIRCYKNYHKPLAIGFDLDDTLYDNQPVLAQAEQKLQAFLHHHFPKSQQYTLGDWLALRNHAISLEPSLVNDTSASRLVALELGLNRLGYSDREAKDGAISAFSEFYDWRNTIAIDQQTHQLLQLLSSHFRLFVISNGNADVSRLGLEHYFEFALHPSPEIAMKPASTLFELAQQRLNIPAHLISYVGDHPISDISGANNVGWQSIWLNQGDGNFDHYKKSLQLPTLELTSLGELEHLI